MPSSKYHREQAQILAGLALTTDDITKADQYKLAAMQHLEKAQTPETGGIAGSETDSDAGQKPQ
jgi:hypothetical protein